MDRNQHEELCRRLTQARRLALEPRDPLTRGRLAEMIEELELLQDQRKVGPFTLMKSTTENRSLHTIGFKLLTSET